VCCDGKGVPSFDRIRYRLRDADVFLYAFDLIELNSDDLRREVLAPSWPRLRPACASTSTLRLRGRQYSPTPARSLLKRRYRSSSGRRG
jgi:hypothetical protein